MQPEYHLFSRLPLQAFFRISRLYRVIYSANTRHFSKKTLLTSTFELFCAYMLPAFPIPRKMMMTTSPKNVDPGISKILTAARFFPLPKLKLYKKHDVVAQTHLSSFVQNLLSSWSVDFVLNLPIRSSSSKCGEIPIFLSFFSSMSTKKASENCFSKVFILMRLRIADFAN